MTLAIFGCYHTQAEAGVVASLLRSAGFEPEVFDEHYGGMIWTTQTALGGYRLMLPAMTWRSRSRRPRVRRQSLLSTCSPCSHWAL